MSWDSEHFDPLPPASIEPPPQPQKHWLKRLLAPLSGIALLIWKVAGPLLLALKNVKLFAFSLDVPGLAGGVHQHLGLAVRARVHAAV